MDHLMINRRTFLKGSLALGFAPWAGMPVHPHKTPLLQYTFRESAGMTGSPSAVVLGGGVAGLAAARELAAHGWSVELFEEDEAVGGLCSSRVIDGFTFDLGPHVFAKEIRNLIAFEPDDLEGTAFSESFLLNRKMLTLPPDLIFSEYIGDILLTLWKNAINPERFRTTNLRELAAAQFGSKIAREIFEPLLEKWCGAPLDGLDTRYLQSRLHSKLEPRSVLDYLANQLNQFLARHEQLQPGGCYGCAGAVSVPNRLMQPTSGLTIHTGSAVTQIFVRNNRIVRIELKDHAVEPDFVISTIPINNLGRITRGAEKLSLLSRIDYLDIILVFVRLKHNGLLKTQWTWIPDRSVPFYRISEMKVLSNSFAPEECTGICLEASLSSEDPRHAEKVFFWENTASRFLKECFSVSEKSIIGINIELKKSAYPNFIKRNTAIVNKLLARPFASETGNHLWQLGVENLALAGRTGSFLYLLTPGAIASGIEAARNATSVMFPSKRSNAGFIC